MAKKGRQIKMRCEKCKNINYTTRKSKTEKEKLELKKHCPVCEEHTMHKEMK